MYLPVSFFIPNIVYLYVSFSKIFSGSSEQEDNVAPLLSLLKAHILFFIVFFIVYYFALGITQKYSRLVVFSMTNSLNLSKKLYS